MCESESLSVVSGCSQPNGLYRNSPGQNTGVGSLSLLQRIFPTQGLNPGLPHCRRILYQQSHKGSPLKPDVNTSSPTQREFHVPHLSAPSLVTLGTGIPKEAAWGHRTSLGLGERHPWDEIPAVLQPSSAFSDKRLNLPAPQVPKCETEILSSELRLGF